MKLQEKDMEENTDEEHHSDTITYEEDNYNFVLDLIRSEKLVSAGPAVYYNTNGE